MQMKYFIVYVVTAKRRINDNYYPCMRIKQEVARRCGKMFQSKQEDKSQRSYDVSLLQQAGAATMMKEEPIDDDTEADNKEEEEDDDVATSNVPSSATNGTVHVLCCCLRHVYIFTRYHVS